MLNFAQFELRKTRKASRKHGSARSRHSLRKPCVQWIGHPVQYLGHSPGESNLLVLAIIHRRSASRCRHRRVGGLADRFQELADDKGVGEYRQYRAATAARVAEQDVKFETALEEVSPLPGPAGEWLAAESGQARLGAQGLLRTVDQVALGLRPLFFAYRLAVPTD